MSHTDPGHQARHAKVCPATKTPPGECTCVFRESLAKRLRPAGVQVPYLIVDIIDRKILEVSYVKTDQAEQGEQEDVESVKSRAKELSASQKHSIAVFKPIAWY